MPYNTTAILPADGDDEATGSCVLPLARIKKIIKLDEDIDACTPGANFLITIATEMFVQHFAEQGYQMTKSERKPRRNMQYKDLANAVSRMDNLEFLTDVVPKTVTYSKALEQQNKQKGAAKREAMRVASNDIMISPERMRTNGVSNGEGGSHRHNGQSGSPRQDVDSARSLVEDEEDSEGDHVMG